MNADQLLVVAILVVALAVFATDRFRVDVVALSVLVALVMTGLLEAEEALAGLSNPAVVTVFAVFILSGALVTTGVADQLAAMMLRFAGTEQWRVVTALMVTCGLMSAFMNNIGATAILLPAALVIADRTDIPASKLLMPLAFASLLGGNLTAIGTPPNILANGILSDHPDLEPFRFFDFAPTGLPVLLVGVGYMAIVGKWVLPARQSSGRLTDLYRFDDYLSTITIGKQSHLVGASLEELEDSIVRPVRVIAVRQGAERRPITPRSATRITPGDVLTVQAALDALAEFTEVHGAHTDIDDSVISWAEPLPGNDEDPSRVNIVEVMVAPDSSLIGRTIGDLELRRRRGLVALAMRRRREPIQVALSDIRLRAGDSLVLTGRDDRLSEVFASDDFVALHSPNLRLRRTRKAPLAVATMVGVLTVAVLGIVSIAIAMLAGVIVLVVTRTISMDEAYSFVDWKAIFLIAGMLPLGSAMEQTGTAQLLADEIVAAIGSAGPLWVMLGIYLMTVGITSVISNAAATVLIVPIAIDAAIAIDASPTPFVMATVIAASTAFLLPIGHQVNVLVYSPGNYHFGDFARVGAGLTFLIMVLVGLLVPVVWPL